MYKSAFTIYFRDVKKSYGLELRLVKDKAKKSDYENKSKRLDEDLNKAVNDVAQLRIKVSQKERQELTAGASRFGTEGKTNDDLLGEAHKIQDDTFASLGRTQALVAASKDVGTATLEVLVNQREQIADITEDVENIGTNLERAERLVTNFGRRMATDRILQMFTFINFILIIAVVAYSVTHKRALSSNSSSSSQSGPN